MTPAIILALVNILKSLGVIAAFYVAKDFSRQAGTTLYEKAKLTIYILIGCFLVSGLFTGMSGNPDDDKGDYVPKKRELREMHTRAMRMCALFFTLFPAAMVGLIQGFKKPMTPDEKWERHVNGRGDL